jgi:hypothetical protein
MERGKLLDELEELLEESETDDVLEELNKELNVEYSGNRTMFLVLYNKIKELNEQQRLIMDKLFVLQERMEAHDMRLAATRLTQQRALEAITNKVFPHT